MKIKNIFIAVFVFSFYSFALIYLRKAKILPVNPSVFFVLFTFFGLFLIIIYSKKIWIKKNPVIKWVFLYSFVITVWSILPNSKINTVGEFALRLYTPFVFLGFNILLLLDDKLKITLKTIKFTVIFSVVMNIYEFFRPASLKFEEYKSLIGRSAGLYTNPNISAIAIIIGVILTIKSVNKKYQTVYLLFGFLGVFLTFSRGGIIVWFLMLFLMIYFKVIKPNLIVLAGILIVFVPVVYLSGANKYFEKEKNTNYNIKNRLNWFSSLGEKTDKSTILRLKAAQRAYNSFKKNPIFGSGIGKSIATRKEKIESHNIYLQLGAQFGIFGIFLFVLLFFMITSGARGEAFKTAVIFSLSAMAWGMVSHNILDKYFFILAANVIAYLNYFNINAEEF